MKNRAHILGLITNLFARQNSAAAYHELERGATLHTRNAVYWMPLKWLGEATNEK